MELFTVANLIALLTLASLEVVLEQGQDLNHVFALLSERNISVKSMRNKSNRLEQLFVSLLHRPDDANNAGAKA